MNKLAIVEFTNILQTNNIYTKEDILNKLINEQYNKAFLYNRYPAPNKPTIKCDSFEITLTWKNQKPWYIDIYDMQEERYIFIGSYFNLSFIEDLLMSLYYEELSLAFDFINSDIEQVKEYLNKEINND